MTPSVSPVTWESRPLVSGENFAVRCGRRIIRIAAAKEELSLDTVLAADADDSPEPKSEPTEWDRWALKSGSELLHLMPGMPDLPVLVAPETPLHVLPEAKLRVFLRIPVSVVVRVGSSTTSLLELPTEQLSHTWFGELDSGELCYWLPTALSRDVDDDLPPASLRAPVTIRNESAEILPVTKLCLRVAHLSVYESGNELWTNETLVRYQGGLHLSKITLLEGPPEGTLNARLVGEPREKGPSKVGRTFRSLRRWTTELLTED